MVCARACATTTPLLSLCLSLALALSFPPSPQHTHTTFPRPLSPFPCLHPLEDPKDALLREYLEQIEKLKAQLGDGGLEEEERYSDMRTGLISLARASSSLSHRSSRPSSFQPLLQRQ